MAAPLVRRKSAGAGALELLERAVHLLRAAPAGTLAWHGAGSLPMAVAAAWFWSEITHPNAAAARLAADALLLALLFAWLNVCRAVFASRLRDRLAGTASAGDWRRAAGTQVFLGATKLIVLPVALAAGVLLAPAVAFYRNAAALAASEPGIAALTARARRYARYRGKQNWQALGLLACLFPLVFVNTLIVLAFLPQMARILTGYESAYSRMGAHLAEDPLFWILVLAAAWLVFDPFVQAVYCLRCFEAESAETGEDVKAAVRRLNPRAAAALLLFCCALAAPALRAETVPPPDLRRAAQQAAQAPEYDWRIPPPPPGREAPNWFVAATGRILTATRAFFNQLSGAIGRFIRWIFGRPSMLPAQDGAPPAGSLPAGLWVLIVVVAAGAAYAILRARRPSRTRAASAPAAVAATREDAEDMDPLRFPEEAWVELAERSMAAGDWRLAMRAFYLASLGWLGRREYLQIHSGKTNREYTLELRRRTAAAPAARDLFAYNVAAFERCWYGMHEPGAEEVEQFRTRVRELQRQLEAAA
ncbi:MAG: DUF4129 domain-containing protein [Acidobacteria bacterium]|nr:DUF4129 domain-containing protein [Acidobacteriota bacterium]